MDVCKLIHTHKLTHVQICMHTQFMHVSMRACVLVFVLVLVLVRV